MNAAKGAALNHYSARFERAARDDAAFFLALFYRKHGYSKVDVYYKIDGSGSLLLDVNEGPLVTLGTITFVGNHKETAEKPSEYAVGPTRERYSKLQKNLPFVASDVEEGADRIHRPYVAEGFLDSGVEPPKYEYAPNGTQMNATIVIDEGQQYFFGAHRF